MFVRYHGGGIGHTSVHCNQVTIDDDSSDDEDAVPQEEPAGGDNEQPNNEDANNDPVPAEVSTEAELLELVPEMSGRAQGSLGEDDEEDEDADADVSGDEIPSDEDEDDEDGTAENSGEEGEGDARLEGRLMAEAEGFWGDEYDGEGFAPL